jgi:hypothetical protein
MMLSGQRWIRLVVGGLVALAASLLAPAPARAACGSHVRYGAPEVVRGESPDQPLRAPALPQRPCEGPHCSQAPSDLPEAPPPTSSRSTGQDDLTLALPGTADVACGIDRVADAHRQVRIHHVPDITHPPR